MKDLIKKIVYRAIREVAHTDDPFRFEVHNDICFDIAYRAVEIALEKKPRLPRPSAEEQQAIAERILKAAAGAAGATVEALRGKSREQGLVLARVAAARLMKEAGLSQPVAGRELLRDHSTINYYLKQEEWMREHEERYQRIYDGSRARLNGSRERLPGEMGASEGYPRAREGESRPRPQGASQ